MVLEDSECKVQLQCKYYYSVTWIEVESVQHTGCMEISIKCGEGSTLFRFHA